MGAAKEEGRTPLHQAAADGSAKVVRQLIAWLCDVTAATHLGFTPLHAQQPQRLRVAQLLLPAGANVNAAGSSGITLLHFAARSDHSNVNAATKDGQTPLMWARAVRTPVCTP